MSTWKYSSVVWETTEHKKYILCILHYILHIIHNKMILKLTLINALIEYLKVVNQNIAASKGN